MFLWWWYIHGERCLFCKLVHFAYRRIHQQHGCGVGVGGIKQVHIWCKRNSNKADMIPRRQWWLSTLYCTICISVVFRGSSMLSVINPKIQAVLSHTYVLDMCLFQYTTWYGIQPTGSAVELHFSFTRHFENYVRQIWTGYIQYIYSTHECTTGRNPESVRLPYFMSKSTERHHTGN